MIVSIVLMMSAVSSVALGLNASSLLCRERIVGSLRDDDWIRSVRSPDSRHCDDWAEWDSIRLRASGVNDSLSHFEGGIYYDEDVGEVNYNSAIKYTHTWTD